MHDFRASLILYSWERISDTTSTSSYSVCMPPHTSIIDLFMAPSYGLTHVVNASRVMLRDVKLADCPILALPNPPERN